MHYPELDLENYLVQRSIAEFPREIRSVLSRIIEDIKSGESKGKAPHDMGEQFHGDINLIPSDEHGRCCTQLVAICYDKDNFDTRILECLDHAAIICPKQNQSIFFFSTQWNTVVASKYIGYIESLRRNGVSVDMVYMTRRGLVLMPI